MIIYPALGLLLSFVSVLCYNDFLYIKNPDADLTMKQILEKHGYPLEFHENIETEDGYILSLQRIPHGRNINANHYSNDSDSMGTSGSRPVAFLMHGILLSGESWIIPGPESGLAYVLADRGYDVWLGNCRGVENSRKHKLYNADTDQKYWMFTWHEMGIYDLPALIDYVLKVTNRERLTYIAHSQGTTAFFVMTSEKPEYNEKIDLMIGLAPVAYMSNVRVPFIKRLAPRYRELQDILQRHNMYEALPFRKELQRVGKVFCSEVRYFQDYCILPIFSVCGTDWELLNRKTVPYMISRFPEDISLLQLIHYFQLITNGNFRKYDHGPTKNMEVYSMPKPPDYMLEKITAPVALIYGHNDLLATEKDVLRSAKRLRNLVEVRAVPYKLFSHTDFQAATKLDIILNPIIFEILDKYSTNKPF